MAAPSISVVVPVNRNNEAWAHCVRSLAALDPAPHELIIVADGVADEMTPMVEALSARLVRIPTQQGPAMARNAGATAATGDILLFTDADCSVPDDLCSRVAAQLGEESNLSGVFGSYDREPSCPRFLSQYRNLLHHHVHQVANEEASTFWSGCGALRKEAFEAAGGFDEEHDEPSIEDIELGYRLRSRGFRIKLDKSLQVTHHKTWTPWDMMKTDVFRRAVPWTILALERGFIRDLNLSWRSRISVILAWAGLIALVASIWLTALLPVAAMLTLGVVFLNLAFYRLLIRERGTRSAVAAVPWHWLFQLYTGVGFLLGVIVYLHRRGDVSGS